MILIHKNLAKRWHTFTLPMQMANIGSELHRVVKFKQNNQKKDAEDAFDRTIELIDLTISDKRLKNRTKELTRFREVLAGFFTKSNQYKINSESLENYSLDFAMFART